MNITCGVTLAIETSHGHVGGNPFVSLVRIGHGVGIFGNAVSHSLPVSRAGKGQREKNRAPHLGNVATLNSVDLLYTRDIGVVEFSK
jgi:hypothetical protein